MGCLIWGAWLLVASMRVHGMEDKAIILGSSLTDSDISLLKQFADTHVHIMEAGNYRSMTCQKPEAMLLADTDFITWADCDAVFTGNTSKYMNASPDTIRIRVRDKEENGWVFKARYDKSDIYGTIPAKILDKWRQQMMQVIPNEDKGVVDQRNFAYFQTDESVLNSVQCFAKVLCRS